jgi:hypothetical protein
MIPPLADNWGVKFEVIRQKNFHPKIFTLFLSESEFSEFENFQNKYNSCQLRNH